MISSGLLVGCAPMSRYEAVKSPAILKAVQDARTYSDHNALAKRFENPAKEMRMKAEEQRRLLEHYQGKKLPLRETSAGSEIAYLGFNAPV
jgi:hypothetical protein